MATIAWLNIDPNAVGPVAQKHVAGPNHENLLVFGAVPADTRLPSYVVVSGTLSLPIPDPRTLSITRVQVNNPTASSATLTLTVGDGVTSRIASSLVVPAGVEYDLQCSVACSSGEIVQASSNPDGSLLLAVSGIAA